MEFSGGIERVRRRFGNDVEPWLAGLPERLAELARRWDLTLGAAFPDGNSAITMRAVLAGVPVVLKVTPDIEFAAEQVEVLRAFGRCAPEVLAAAEGALLLEFVDGVVGWPSAERFAALLREMHSAVPDPARIARRELASHSAEFFPMFRPLGPITAEHLRRAGEIRAELVVEQGKPVLLHGDLHRDNLLDAGGRGLVVIDPKACLGEAEFDAVDYVLGGPEDVAERRDALLRVSELDGERLEGWCRATAPLVAIGLVRQGRSIDHILTYMK